MESSTGLPFCCVSIASSPYSSFANSYISVLTLCLLYKLVHMVVKSDLTRDHQETVVPPVEGVAGGGTAYGWSDTGVNDPRPLRGAIDPTKVSSLELLNVWCMPNSANVGPQDMPRELEPISLLAARNERESIQIAIRPKVFWGGSGIAGTVQVQCTDLCSPCGARLVVGQSLTLRRVVPVLGVPDALVPLDMPVCQLNLFPGSTSQSLSKVEKHQLYRELRDCRDAVEPLEGKPLEDVVERVKSATSSLRIVLLSPSFSDFFSDNGPIDMMEEDAISSLSIRLKISLTVWDFVLPATPVPAVIGVSFLVGQRHESFNIHLAMAADHPKSDAYFSDPRLAAYAVPNGPIVPCGDTVKDFLRREVEILRTKNHWRKAYFYLWDEPLNIEQYNGIRSMASEIHAYAPDARILTTYYCGPSDAPLASNNFEAFLKVPEFLRPHTQIYCTSSDGWNTDTAFCENSLNKIGYSFSLDEDLAKDIIAEIQTENAEEWWTYVCLGPGGTGFLYWGANCYEKATVPSAEIKFRRGLPPGDGVLFYPGQVFSSSQQPVASLRLERLLSGLQVIEHLKLYASRFGRAVTWFCILKMDLTLIPFSRIEIIVPSCLGFALALAFYTIKVLKKGGGEKLLLSRFIQARLFVAKPSDTGITIAK
ncbi:hypothetical protein RND71_027515 [Anisodus tanguticus]|uniref:Glycoside hydrolase 123 catalytic domain-containing protein n=1 Tax=Anisodus tanguticus TaxID=243964 RepID=A0AAE1V1T1_9SOLA|nr:hypothetical protein RND71_027515 [Anisodus tanguticus]